MRIVVYLRRCEWYARCVFAGSTVLRMYGKESVEYYYYPD
jgi:hypothetical protein